MVWLEKLPDDWWIKYQTNKLSSECIQEINIELLFLIRSLLIETRCYARVCKRIRLSTNDFQNALTSRNISLSLINNIQHIEQSSISLSSIIKMNNLCSLNNNIQLTIHWLAIDGQQPIISDNPLPNFSEENSFNDQLFELNKNDIEISNQSFRLQKFFQLVKTTKLQYSQITNNIHRLTKNNLILKPIHPRNISIRHSNRNENLTSNLSHELSIEQQLYFKTLTESYFYGTNQQQIDVFHSLTSDAALQPILPRLLLFISQGIQTNIYFNDLYFIEKFLSILKILITNQFISFDKYLHLIIPSLLTCLLCIFDFSQKSIQIFYSLDSIHTNNYSTIWTIREIASDLIIYFEKIYSTIPYLTQRICSIIKSNMMKKNSIITYSIFYASIRTLFAINIHKYRLFTFDILRELNKNKILAIDFDLDLDEQQTLFYQKIKDLMDQYHEKIDL